MLLLTIWPGTKPLAPPSPLIVGLWPARSNTPAVLAPPLTATLPAGSAPASPTVSVPAETATPPLKLLVELASVKAPTPDLANPPLPLTAPPSTRVPASTWIAPAETPRLNGWASLKPAVASSVPPLRVTLPATAPRLAVLLTCTTPALSVVPPL